MSYTCSLFHIVFSTRFRHPSLAQLHIKELLRYLTGIAEKLNSKIVIANAMPEHVHILASLHPDVPLSKFVGTLKQSSSLWLKSNINFAMFDGWAKEYYAVSVSPSNKDAVASYIENQQRHHGQKDFGEEIKWLVESIGMTLHENGFNV